jgi:hypothetical protein
MLFTELDCNFAPLESFRVLSSQNLILETKFFINEIYLQKAKLLAEFVT